MSNKFIPFSVGQPYRDSSGNAIQAVASTADRAGMWFATEGLKVVTFEVVLGVDSGTVTADFYVETTAQMVGAVSAGSRVLLPAGCLHTNLSGAALSTPVSDQMGSVEVTCTTVGAGRFTVTVSDVPAGMMRAVWDYDSNSSAVNPTIAIHASGWG